MAQLIEQAALQAPRLIGIVGAQGQGKTTCAASATENSYKDLVFLSFDLDANIGLEKRGIIAPRYELSGINDFEALKNEIVDITKQLNVRIRDKQTRYVIIDTVSLFDSALLAYFTPRTKDNFELYARISQWHRWFLMDQLMPLTASGARLIVLFQPTYKEDPTGKDAEKVKQQQQTFRQAQGVEPDANKLLALSGKEAAKLYRTQCSLILPIAKTREPAGAKWFLYPNGAGLGFEFKNRFQNILDDKEPADLRALYNKIETFKVKT